MSTESLDLYQKREKIHPKDIKGKFQRIRNTLITLSLLFFAILPWISWHDRQAILFDLPQRKFYFFNITFWPQDFILLSWGLIIAALVLFFVTVLAGRVWCGYTCPQTVWTKLFMWIEALTEGDRNQRIKWDKAKFSVEKALRRAIKHVLWLMISLFTALTIVGFFVPIQTLIIHLFTLQLSFWAGFWLVFFTACTYLNAGFMREQICLYVCPYARFQSVMLDSDSLIVTYDKNRGEPRGKRTKKQDPSVLGLGSCVNCQQCVQVCPTGIDIRDGLQLGCIGCAACVDACDDIMDKMGYPRGLISYSTENRLEGKTSKLLRPRLIGYASILLIMVIAFTYVLLTRPVIGLDILRDRTTLYRQTPEGLIENVYTLKIRNMSQQTQRYHIQTNTPLPHQLTGTTSLSIPSGEIAIIPVQVKIDKYKLPKTKIDLPFVVTSENNPKQRIERTSKFLSPEAGYDRRY